MRLALSAIAAALLAACTSQPDYRASDSTPPTVPSVDLDRYAGLWYEIARYPNGFELGWIKKLKEKIVKIKIGIKLEYEIIFIGKF